MDRNVRTLNALSGLKVALRKESVDRNLLVAGSLIMVGGVALRKESVDRNTPTKNPMISINKVALRKESVDRNKYVVQCRKTLGGRSPQGERG